MALSNSERQARYRQRLRDAASAVDLPERISEAMDAAVKVVWDIWKRENYGGIEEFPDWQSMRAALANGGSTPLRSWFEDLQEESSAEELAALAKAVSIVDAVTFAHAKLKKSPKAKGRGRGGAD